MSEPLVLLVEDDPLDAALVRRALLAAGVTRIELCVSLADTLERLADPERPAPAVVLLDLTLPDADGIETFDRLAAASPPPVVVMSGHDDLERALALIERGAQDYLVKGEMSGAAIARSLHQSVERARLRRELEEARDRAELASRAQSAFVAAMSHEIRTPLNAILGMAELLAQTRLDLDQREYVEIFRRCGRALKGLLDNALEISRFETGRIELSHEPFELDALVQECLEAFAFTAHRQSIALVADVAESAIGSVVGDEARLRQVLFNLVGNAVKFTESGRVVMHAEARADGVVIEVVDTGIGIPENRLEAVFERFVQAESGTTRRFGGSGLGLALCRELVRAMGGQIGVESREGAGSTFRVELPLRVEPRRIPAALGGDTVLVLIADPVERDSLAKRLAAHGARVEATSSVEQAERALRERRFEALLFDARLEGRGGLELLDELDAAVRPPHCAVLLPMAHRVGDLARCDEAGVVALCKPARFEDVVAALRGEGLARQAAPASALPPSLAGRTVLLAEDGPENRTVVLAHLRATGCAVEIAVDGAEAVEKAAGSTIDLVLMDVHMPRLDGCEATRRIRAAERESGRRRTPIVALTADALPEQRAACVTAGCDAYLGKPFTREGLYAVLARFLGGDEAQGEGAPPQRPAESADEVAAAIPPELADLAEGYLANRRADAAKLLEALRCGDLEQARRLGHNIKGSGAGYGFARVSELGAEIERAAQHDDAGAVERSARALDEYAEKTLRSLAAR